MYMNQVFPAGFPSLIEQPPSLEHGIYFYVCIHASHFQTNYFLAHYVEVMFFLFYLFCMLQMTNPDTDIIPLHDQQSLDSSGCLLFLDTLSQKLNKIAHKHNLSKSKLRGEK